MTSSLKILTLDGGGLQALTTLGILNDVCEKIGESSGVKRSPAPYELFDIICGIGTGGWLALLLGRFRLDVMTCMSVYMDIASAIDPQAAPQASSKRPNRGYAFDQKKLIAKVEQVLERYDLDVNLLEHAPEADDARCRYVFAAGVIDDNAPEDRRKYQLFRTYNPKKSESTDQYFRPGPDPKRCKLSDACAATGAAQGLLKPCKIGGTSFFDNNFPHPHKISSLALDEAYCIYGEKAALSLVLNIGPSIPSPNDVQQIRECSSTRFSRLARKFSWPKKGARASGTTALTAENLNANLDTVDNLDKPPTRSDSSLSTAASDTERRLQLGIRNRLIQDYGSQGDQLYHHIGPVEQEFAQNTLSLNDVSAIDLSNAEVKTWRECVGERKRVEQVAQQYVCVAARAA